MANPSAHNILLLQISEDLSKSDLENLLFCCSDVISESAASGMRRGIQLFKALKHRNLLGPGQYDYLRKCLTAIERVDLASKLPSELEAILSLVPTHNRSLVHGGAWPCLSCSSEERSLKCPELVRALFLQVADCLTAEDVSKLSYLFPSKLYLEDRQEMDGRTLLLQLEDMRIINPSHPETLARYLHYIERRDLASLLLSIQNPQIESFSLDQHSQLLNFKLTAFLNKRSHYSFQSKVMSTIANSDTTVFKKHFENVFLGRLVKSFDYSYVNQLCMSALLETDKLDDLLGSTLPMVLDYTETYLDYYNHFFSSNGSLVSVSAFDTLFQRCQNIFDRFEKQVAPFSWNSTMRRSIKEDLAHRRGLFGCPAYHAVTCIHDVCSEVAGGAEVEALMRDADRNVFALESHFYAYSYETVMAEWLQSVLCLLTTSGHLVSYNPETLRATLLRIVRRHQDQICSCYSKLARVLGEDITKRIAAELLKEDIHIAPLKPRHSPHPTLNLAEYVENLRTLIYTCLLALLQHSYFGEDLDLSRVLSELKRFLVQFVSSDYFMSIVLTVCQKVISAYKFEIDSFREGVLRSNTLCAPVLRQILSV